MEDPSEELQLVRDFVDCENCLQLPACQSKELWSKGFTSEIVQEMGSKFKINKVRFLIVSVFLIKTYFTIDKVNIIFYHL